MKKIFGLGILVAGLVGMAFGANRVGPVSQYGQLQAGKNSSNVGRIYGSCPTYSKSGNEVSVQGSSLFWSGASEGAKYWTSSIIDGLVSKHNVEVVRAPMSVDETGWKDSDHYFKNKSTYQNLMKTVVDAAVKNDIYVIIDYHSHYAEQNVNNAKTFFAEMAQAYGDLDNVIFEIYNEPVGPNGSKEWINLSQAESFWSTIKTYAEAVITEIRKYSDNLIVVGTPYFDQYPNAALKSPLSDKNVAYTFHYYAGEDPYKHTISNQGANAVAAMNGGLSVFVTEWGNSAPSGNGGFDSTYSFNWYKWMAQNKLSGANWAVTDKDETASYFKTSGAWNYSQSGSWTNDFVFAENPSTYKACDGSANSQGGSNVSSSSVSISSSSFVVTEANLIDDFEDGDSTAYTGLKDTWFAFTDVNDKGASSISNTKNKDGYNVVFTADNGSNYMAGLKNILLNQGGNEYAPYVNLGVSVEKGLSGCRNVVYRYKGAGHNLKAVMSGDENGELTDYNYHKTAIPGSDSWETISVPVGNLNQEVGWGNPLDLDISKVVNLQWEVKGTASNNYLYIDDVACDGVNITRPEKPTITPVVTTFSLTSGNAVQSVVAGEAIVPIVYKYENVTGISASGLPSGLNGVLDETAKTYTISGTVASNLSTKDYDFTIAVTGVDENTSATGTIKVTRAPVVTTFSLTSGNAVQSVVAGEAIVPIVYKYENVTGISATGLPKGLSGNLDETAKTYTISGTVASNLSTKDYDFTIAVTGVDENTSATGAIKVTRAPVVTTFSLTSGNAVQSVVAGEAIVPIVYKYENVTGISATGLPKGLSGNLDETAKTYTIDGTVNAFSGTFDYVFTIDVTGVDENTSSSGTIKVTAASEESSSSVEQNVSSSSAEPEQSSSSGDPETSSSMQDDSSSSSEQAISSSSAEPEQSSSSEDPETSSSLQDDSSSSSEQAISSSSAEPEQSSSSEDPETSSSMQEISSSNSEPEVSSSSVAIEESSSSVEQDASSSSAEQEESSSSMDDDDITVVMSDSRVIIGTKYVNNTMTVSLPKSADVKIDVFDMMGNAVKSYKAYVIGSASFDMSTLRRGSYLVRIVSGTMGRTLRATVR